MGAELGKAYVQIVPSAEGISGSISSIISPEATTAGKTAGLNIAGGIGTALKTATGVIAAGTAAVTTTIVKGTQEVASYGDNIDKMSQKMGLSAQAYQEWDAVMQHSGTSMSAMKASMKTLANAAQTNNKAFAELGITQEQLNNMSQEQLFEATISALQNVEDTTTRTYLAGKTLGKGATELGALLNTSAEDTQAMRDRVRELGGVMSDDAVKSAALFQDNMQDLQTALSGVGRNMMSELLPSMNNILAGFTSLIIGEENATQQLSTGFSELFTSLSGIAENIVSTITQMMPNIIAGIAEILPQLITMATQLIISLAEALVDAMPQLITTVVPSLAVAAGKIVIAFGQAIVRAAPQLLNAGVEMINAVKSAFGGGEMLDEGLQVVTSLLDGITANLPDVLNKGIELVTNIANGILQNLPSLITAAGTLLTSFTQFLMQNFPTIMQKGAELLLNLVNGIINNLPQIVSAVAQVIAKFLATVVQNLPRILQSGIEIIAKLVVGLIQAIPKVIAAIPQIISAIVRAFGQYDWGSIGRNILEGVKNGIIGAVSAVVDAARRAAQSIWDAVSDFFDIGSPSKKMAWIGEMVDAGFAKGISENSDMIDDAISDITPDMTSQLKFSADYGEFGQEQKTAAPVTVNMTVYGAEGQDVNALAEIIQDKINNAINSREFVYA